MELRSSCLVSLAMLAACTSSGGPSAEADAGPGGDGGGQEAALTCEGKSGSRLRQLVRDHDDGSSEVVHLVDSERGLGCVFMTAPDGQLRCMPRVDRDRVYGGILRYRDSSCSQPIGSVEPDVHPVLFEYAVPQGEGCNRRFHRVYTEVGAATDIAEGDQIYYRDPQGDCAAATASTATYYRLGEPIPPERFVAGSEIWTDGGRLSMRTVDAEDGARFCDVLGQLRDTELEGADCGLSRAEDGAIRCLPQSSVLSEYFADDDCTEALSLAQSDTCRPVNYITATAPAECDRLEVRRMGDTVTSQLYWDPGGVCDTFDPGDTARFSLPGPVVAADSFAEIRREYARVGGRLERGDLVGEGVRLHRSRWRDTTLDIPCGFSTAGDGVERCLPATDPSDGAAIAAGTRYTDPDCSVGILVAWYRPDCKDTRPAYVREQVGETAVIHQAGDEHPGPFYVDDGTGCVAAAADEVHLSVGPVVDPATFASGVHRLE